jgi:hypothetical protein
MHCPHAEKCPFFLKKNPIHEAMYKTNMTRYCENNFTACSLYRVIRDGDISLIPHDLYPNQSWRVAKILASK